MIDLRRIIDPIIEVAMQPGVLIAIWITLAVYVAWQWFRGRKHKTRINEIIAEAILYVSGFMICIAAGAIFVIYPDHMLIGVSIIAALIVLSAMAYPTILRRNVRKRKNEELTTNAAGRLEQTADTQTHLPTESNWHRLLPR